MGILGVPKALHHTADTGGDCGEELGSVKGFVNFNNMALDMVRSERGREAERERERQGEGQREGVKVCQRVKNAGTERERERESFVNSTIWHSTCCSEREGGREGPRERERET